MIWALVKSGQIENIDRNIQIIADWAESQMPEEDPTPDELPNNDDSESTNN